MSRHLPARPNLEHLKKQAKDRLTELRRRDSTATLAAAQHAIAREYGFANWLKLKLEVLNTRAHPLAGHWIAHLTPPPPDPASPVRAELRIDVAGDLVTIVDTVTNRSGTVETRTSSVTADGAEYRVDQGYSLLARWMSHHGLETVARKGDRDVGRVTYEVSPDDARLTVWAIGMSHDGYPATERRLVFDRGTDVS